MSKRKFTYDNGSGGIAEVIYDTANEGKFGGFKTAEKDQPYNFVIMEKDQLDYIRDDLKSIKGGLNSRDEQHKKELSNLRNTYQTKLDKRKAEYDDEINRIQDTAEEDITEWRDKYNHEVEMNFALRNASKERANRIRKMDKHGPGFKPMSWSTFSYKLMRKDGKKTYPVYYNLYKITIQTYYDVSLTLDQADAEIRQALLSAELILGNCNPVFYDERENSVDQILLRILDEDEKNKDNSDYVSLYDRSLILRRDYKCDYQRGFWEVTFITNFPYEEVFEEGDDDDDIHETT